MTFNLCNPVSTFASHSLSRYQNIIQRAGKDLNTGYKSKNDVVSSILGTSLKHNASMLRSVSKNIGYGVMLSDKAGQDLEAAKDTLIGLKKIIAQSSTASAASLAELNKQYLSGEEQLKKIFRESKVDGLNFFEHEGVLNVDIRAGETFNDTIRLRLPDMRAITTGLKGDAGRVGNTKHSLVAGDAWTQEGRTAVQNQQSADNFIDKLITVVDNASNHIMLQRENLIATNRNLLENIRIHDSACDGYLKTDYQEAAEELKNAMTGFQASIAVMIQGEMIPRSILRLLEQH
jgi:flagellin-like hook-associated protein FlgL